MTFVNKLNRGSNAESPIISIDTIELDHLANLCIKNIVTVNRAACYYRSRAVNNAFPIVRGNKNFVLAESDGLVIIVVGFCNACYNVLTVAVALCNNVSSPLEVGAGVRDGTKVRGVNTASATLDLFVNGINVNVGELAKERLYLIYPNKVAAGTEFNRNFKVSCFNCGRKLKSIGA